MGGCGTGWWDGRADALTPGSVDCWSTAVGPGCRRARAARDSRLTVDSTPSPPAQGSCVRTRAKRRRSCSTPRL
ncbi:hypothetical protein D7Y61_21430 [Stenotrophomonas maltophilia]|nr:hypothetical protein [Stenotrophomonas maltophilia]